MDHATWVDDDLVALGTCGDALDWARGYDTAQEAWDACERGDWMLWLLGMLAGPPESDSRRKLVLAACACARLSLPHVQAGEDRPRHAIETAESWARQEQGVTLAMVEAAAWPAGAAGASAGASGASAGAAGASAWAAGAAAWAAWAAGAAWAAWAARAAAWAAEAAGAAGADRAATLRHCADIVRTAYPQYPHKEK